MGEIEQFDVVALIADDMHSPMRAGDKGAVLEFMPGGALEVEFADEEGKTQHIGYYNAAEMQRVWSAKSRRYVDAEDDGPDMEIVAAGLAAIEDSRAGRLLTIEEADARFEQDLAQARERVRVKMYSPAGHG